MKKTKNLMIKIDEELLATLKMDADTLDVSMSQIVRQALRQRYNKKGTYEYQGDR